MPDSEKSLPSIQMSLSVQGDTPRVISDVGDLVLVTERIRHTVFTTHVTLLQSGARPFWTVILRDGIFCAQLWIGQPTVLPTNCEMHCSSLDQVHNLLPRGLRRLSALEGSLILERWASAPPANPRQPRPVKLLPSTLASVAAAMMRDAYENGVYPLPGVSCEKAAEQLAGRLGVVGNTAYDLAFHMHREFGWGNTPALVQVLEEGIELLGEMLLGLLETWEMENILPTPALKPGTAIRTKDGLTGIVGGMYGFGVAQYLLGISLPGGIRIVQEANIEDVKPF